MRAVRFADLRLLLASLWLTSACGGDEAPVAKPEDGTEVEPAATDEGDDADDSTAEPTDDGKPAPSTPNKPTTPVKTDAGIDASAGTKPDAGPAVKPVSDAGPSGSTSGKDGGESAGPGPSEASGSGDSSCLDSITDYTKDGPFKFAAKSMGAIKFWVPEVPAGCKVPVVHLANGTTASCSNYQPSLNRLASHGFLTACYEDPDTGAGTQGLMAFEAAFAMFPDLAAKKLGSTGHSQGGQAAFVVLARAEEKFGLTDYIYAGLAMEPASGFGERPTPGTWQSWYAKIKSPMFMFSGTADMLVSESWVQQGFAAMAKDNETYWWSATGATHIPVPNEAEQQVSIPWFRWKLLGDKAACEAFKKLPGNGKWEKRKEQNVKECG